MTYLGTRPPTVDEWDKYELHHRARLATKPGLTGMWQVSGRSNTDCCIFSVKSLKKYLQWHQPGQILNPENDFFKKNIEEIRTMVCVRPDNQRSFIYLSDTMAIWFDPSSGSNREENGKAEINPCFFVCK